METTGSGMVDQVAKNYREMLVWMGAFQVVKWIEGIVGEVDVVSNGVVVTLRPSRIKQTAVSVSFVQIVLYVFIMSI